MSSISMLNALVPCDRPRILLLTFNRNETQAVTNQFCNGDPIPSRRLNGIDYNYLGVHGEAHIFHGVSLQGVTAAQLSTAHGIQALHPKAVIGVGIAFGVSERTQTIGDVLVTTAVKDYDLKRVNRDGSVTLRAPTPPASRTLVERLNYIAHNMQSNSTNGWPKVQLGIWLSGNSLIDNIEFRNQLVRQAGTDFVGGDMEMPGIQAQADALGVDWLGIKAINDFADGEKRENEEHNQKLAAANAARVAHRALATPLYFDEDHRAQACPRLSRKDATWRSSTPMRRGVSLKG